MFKLQVFLFNVCYFICESIAGSCVRLITYVLYFRMCFVVANILTYVYPV